MVQETLTDLEIEVFLAKLSAKLSESPRTLNSEECSTMLEAVPSEELKLFPTSLR